MSVKNKARLLLIDDSMPDLRVLTEIATARGWAVSVAFNGKDGYHKARLSHFDLILLDVNMPELDGFGTCRLLKADPHTRHIPVIFLSAAGEQTNRLDGLLLGAVDYIVKSYANEEEIAARIAISLQRASYESAEEADDRSINDALPSAVLVRAAKQILQKQIAQPPVARELASQLGSNEKILNEAFREQYGVTVFGWLRDERLRVGRQLLAATDLSITEIAESLGYSSSQNFATAFKERFETSPREFRDGLRRTTTS